MEAIRFERRVDPELLAQVEALRDRVKRGEITAIAYGTVRPDGANGTGFSVDAGFIGLGRGLRAAPPRRSFDVREL